MAALQASGAAVAPPEAARSLVEGWASEAEARKAGRRARELDGRAEARGRLTEQMVRARDEGRREAATAGPAEAQVSEQAWEERLRGAYSWAREGVQEGTPASVAEPERRTGLADGAEAAGGPRVTFVLQRRVAAFGGEARWMQADGVDEEGDACMSWYDHEMICDDKEMMYGVWLRCCAVVGPRWLVEAHRRRYQR